MNRKNLSTQKIFTQIIFNVKISRSMVCPFTPANHLIRIGTQVKGQVSTYCKQ